jgi:hypothetical protein
MQTVSAVTKPEAINHINCFELFQYLVNVLKSYGTYN